MIQNCRDSNPTCLFFREDKWPTNSLWILRLFFRGEKNIYITLVGTQLTTVDEENSKTPRNRSGFIGKQPSILWNIDSKVPKVQIDFLTAIFFRWLERNSHVGGRSLHSYMAMFFLYIKKNLWKKTHGKNND